MRPRPCVPPRPPGPSRTPPAAEAGKPTLVGVWDCQARPPLLGSCGSRYQSLLPWSAESSPSSLEADLWGQQPIRVVLRAGVLRAGGLGQKGSMQIMACCLLFVVVALSLSCILSLSLSLSLSCIMSSLSLSLALSLFLCLSPSPSPSPSLSIKQQSGPWANGEQLISNVARS